MSSTIAEARTASPSATVYTETAQADDDVSPPASPDPNPRINKPRGKKNHNFTSLHFNESNFAPTNFPSCRSTSGASLASIDASNDAFVTNENHALRKGQNFKTLKASGLRQDITAKHEQKKAEKAVSVGRKDAHYKKFVKGGNAGLGEEVVGEDELEDGEIREEGESGLEDGEIPDDEPVDEDESGFPGA
jgi:hypothetical protein